MPEIRSNASSAQIFLRFLSLGCTSFGGPVAHIGYFRREFVVRLGWLDEATFAELVALCQSLPGPSSSQLGFAIGLLQCGFPGALAAWLAFTLPSAILMFTFASGYAIFHNPFAADLLHGLQLVAVAVVAQAVLRMAQTLTPDLIRILMAVVAGFIVLFFHHPFSQLAAITAGAIYGLVACRTIAITPPTKISLSFSRRIGTLAFGLFVFLLLTPSIVLAFKSFQAVAVFQAFYRTGALVFGGGHVVLPLLQTAVVSPGWIDETTFLAGYGGAQALPGPLFTFAAYLGALLKPQPHGLSGAALGLIAIFLPGLLLVICILPFWSRLRANPNIRFALAGINASVVGILAAALYRPVFTSSVRTLPDYLITFLSVLALLVGKVPLWIVLLFTTTIAAILPGILRAIH